LERGKHTVVDEGNDSSDGIFSGKISAGRLTSERKAHPPQRKKNEKTPGKVVLLWGLRGEGKTT